MSIVTPAVPMARSQSCTSLLAAYTNSTLSGAPMDPPNTLHPSSPSQSDRRPEHLPAILVDSAQASAIRFQPSVLLLPRGTAGEATVWVALSYAL